MLCTIARATTYKQLPDAPFVYERVFWQVYSQYTCILGIYVSSSYHQISQCGKYPLANFLEMDLYIDGGITYGLTNIYRRLASYPGSSSAYIYRWAII